MLPPGHNIVISYRDMPCFPGGGIDFSHLRTTINLETASTRSWFDTAERFSMKLIRQAGMDCPRRNYAGGALVCIWYFLLGRYVTMDEASSTASWTA